jgi:hypothetical protein
MVDRYTKAVLTVIAAALMALAIQGFIRPLEAQTRDLQRVQICDGEHCASLSKRVTRIGRFETTDWALATQIDGLQKVEICNGKDLAGSCATVDYGGTLRVSPR